MTDKVQTKVYLPPDVKAMLDADPRSNSEAVEAALVAEYGGEKMTAVERRLDEYDRRISMIDSEINEREREKRELGEEKNALEERVEQRRTRFEQQLDDVADILKGVPLDPDNPAVQTQAEKLDLTPDELITKLQDHA